MPARPDVLALALIRHSDGDRILVSLGGGFDRPFGGKVEHGELSHETVARELLEELDLVVTVDEEPRQVLQSRFMYRDEDHHQIVFVHDAALVDTAAYARTTFSRVDHEGSVGRWRSLSDPPPEPLYPEGLDLSRR